jgi:hypothetical protein
MEKEKKPTGKGKMKPGAKETIVINPPEPNVRPVDEKFSAALDTHIICEKVAMVLEAKANMNGIPPYILETVYKRGTQSATPSHLSIEQHAMNRVNSFIAFGEAFLQDHDLIDLEEKVGLKGTGGGARPHIKVETNPFNGKKTFHIIDAKGRRVHSTNDQGEAKQHLATRYHSLFHEEKGVELDPAKREVGTDSLVKLYKDATPGQSDTISEVSSELLDRYKDKAKKSADSLTAQGQHKKSTDRWMNVMKATGKQIDKTTSNIKKALHREEVDALFTEATARNSLSKAPVGKIYLVDFLWRGKPTRVQMFFPSMKRPSPEDIKKQLNRTFKDSSLKKYDMIQKSGDYPLLVIQEGGLWDNIRKRREKGLPRLKPGDKNYPETLDIQEEPKLNKPMRTPGGPKKFSVYVKSDKGNVKKVNFGDPNMEIKRDDPDRRAAYRSRHNCDNPGPKTKANYWSCRNWGSKPVGK